MVVILASVVFLICLSCGEEARVRESAELKRKIATEKNAEFIEYIDSFNLGYKEFLGRSLSAGNIRIEFVPGFEGTKVGECNHGARRIRLDQKFWEGSDEYTRKALIYHEFGHCVLGRGHLETTEGDMPLSLMYPDMYVALYFPAHREEYLEELFTGSTNQFLEEEVRVNLSTISDFSQDGLCEFIK
ncbi:MAG: hypothetical protein CME62_14085 [Halobacteriovoraceae bacterium]|nr:hypothetical protein [Halobacteriovoraceae bacterium]